MQNKIQSMQQTFQREMLFRMAGQIGGIFGGFISLRKVLNYWSIPGILLGSRLMGSTGAIVATGSAAFGSLLRTFEAWRDRRMLKQPALQSSLNQKTPQLRSRNFSVNLELEQAMLDPLPDVVKFSEKTDQEQLRVQMSQQIEAAFEKEMPGVLPGKNSRLSGRIRRRVWRFSWNFLPAIILTAAFFAIVFNLVGYLPFLPAVWHKLVLPTSVSFYLNILAVMFGVCYFQYLWLLFRLRKSASRVGDDLLEFFRQQEHPWLANLTTRLAAPETWCQHALKLEDEVSRLQNKLRQSIKGVEVI